ncbi:hypothetical protein O3M35_005557 [Rhynocoris fuscipes]|uniref:Amine oxidase domain-containing protein n=1 Tax=Rhynocoris fuscipes TaxID=488301 RepID=A0AAW1DJ30_9HEMI
MKFLVFVTTALFIKVPLIYIFSSKIRLFFCPNTIERSSPRIVIIGAGVAGIAAATSLLDRGFDNVTVIEAEDRIGGRVHSVPFGKKHVDLGAHWIHGEVDNPVYGLVHEMDIVHHSGDYNNLHFVSDDGRTIPTNVGMNLFAQTGQLFENEAELRNFSGSLRDFLLPRCKELGKDLIPEQELLNAFVYWVEKYVCIAQGCDNLRDISAAGLTHYKESDGDQLLAWNSGGYRNIIDILLRRHPKCVGPPVPIEDHLVLNTKVKEIDWNGQTAFVKCEDHRIFKADHVIVTVSLGVLKEKYRSLFNPALPIEKIQAIKGLGIGIVNKIYLKFPHRWWPEDCSGFSLLRIKNNTSRESVHPWEDELIGFYTESAIDPTVLGGWIVGDAAREMEVKSDEDVLDGCYRVLKRFLSHTYEIPRPTSILRSKWFSNENFRGSYSFRSVTTEMLNTSSDILAKPLFNDYKKQMLMFAGEATHNHFYSTVHGAMDSGWREAQRIAEMYATLKE